MNPLAAWWKASPPPAPPAREAKGVHPAMAELIALRPAAVGLGLSWQRRVLSAQSGGYLSPFRGRGIDFDHVRVYQPGDDIRAMDWRVTARTGRPHTKIFREERERPGWLVVDVGESMRFGTRTAFKSVVAVWTAALLGWGLADNGDRVGGILSGGALESELPPTAGQRGMARLLRELMRVHDHPPRGSGLLSALERMTRAARPGGILFILSDFRALEEEGLRRMGQLSRHNDVVAIQIFDPLEAALPGPGYYRFGDGERTLGGEVGRDALREHARRHGEFQAVLRRSFRALGIHVIPLSTDAPLVATLTQGLHQREHHRLVGERRS